MLTENLGSNLSGKFGSIEAWVVADGEHIYRGATVVIRLTDGLAYNAVDDPTDEYKQLVVGWALEEVIGDTSIPRRVRTRADGKLVRYLPNVDQADIGKLACVKDNDTVQLYAEGECAVVCGRITSINVERESCYVDFTKIYKRIAESAYD